MAAKMKKKITAGPQKKRRRSGKTAVASGHSHSFKLDKNGNGDTSRDQQHVHTIRSWSVRPGGKANHIHSI